MIGPIIRAVTAAATASQTASNIQSMMGSWEHTFSNWLPSHNQVVKVAVRGKKGTPFRHVLHTALATAFGTLAVRRFSLGDVGLQIHCDYMTNTVQIEYAVHWGAIGKILAQILDQYRQKVIAPGSPGKSGNVVDGKILSAERGMAAIAQFPTMPGLIIRKIGGIVVGGGVGGLGPMLEAGFQKVGEQIIKIFEEHRGLFLGNFDDVVWGDPKSSKDARRLGYLPRESVEAHPPPWVFKPKDEKYPEPFKGMIAGFANDDSGPETETMITRRDLDTKNKPAGNPGPPIPRDTTKPWPYDKIAPTLEAATETDGFAFDLRTLVAQALSDPDVNQPAPQSTRSFLPPEGWGVNNQEPII